MPESDNIEFNNHVFPMEFISLEKRSTDLSESILLTCVQHLLSLSWPICPKQPPALDLGTSIENFVRNLINKNKLDSSASTVTQNCQIPQNTGMGQISSEEKSATPPTSNIDYNRFIELLQTMLSKQGN